MAFTIHTAGTRDVYDDSHIMSLTDSGALEVKDRASLQLVKLYSPNFWTYVVPGEPKPSASPRTRRAVTA